MNKHKQIKQITVIAVLIALGAVLSLFDRQISNLILTTVPMIAVFLPNLKLGIANIVVLIILYHYNFKTSLVAIILKSIIVGLFGTLITFIIGFTGTFLSFLVMYILIKFLKKGKTILFVSAVGGFVHSLGQVLASFTIYGLNGNIDQTKINSAFLYSPFILLVGIITGILMGYTAYKVNQILTNQHLIQPITKPTRTYQPLYVGHRGGRVYGGVENTKEAFLGGIRSGVKALECDVRVTRDGCFIIYHDHTLERLTKVAEIDSQLDVNQTTWDVLKAVKLYQTYDGKTYDGTICLFSEYLSLCKQYNMIPIIELKWTNGIYSHNDAMEQFDYSNIDGLVDLIKQYGLYEVAYVMTSMRGCLEYLRKTYPDLALQWLCSKQCEKYLDWCIANKISIDVQFEYCTKEIVKKAHEHQLVVNIWTLNDATKLARYLEMNVDMITSDYLTRNKSH